MVTETHLTWGQYLARGVTVHLQTVLDDSFLIEYPELILPFPECLSSDRSRCTGDIQVIDVPKANSLSALLLKHGWCLLSIDEDQCPISSKGIESLFAQAFQLDELVKRRTKRVSHEYDYKMGWRKEADNNAEFFETRLEEDGGESDDVDEKENNSTTVRITTAPQLPIEDFTATVLTLFKLLSSIGAAILTEISISILELDPRSILNLTDLWSHMNMVTLQEHSPRTSNLFEVIQNTLRSSYTTFISPSSSSNVATANEEQQSQQFSSSLLRICQYSPRDEEARQSISFGAHTDTSFITIGICSSSPGLEIWDQHTKGWINAERIARLHQLRQPSKKVYLIVFLGEVLQMISKSTIKATVHRVATPREQVRLSCPFLIRGRLDAAVNIHDKTCGYNHPGGQEALDAMPDMTGMDMRTLHRYLDLKRIKCYHSNRENKEEWVLRAFS